MTKILETHAIDGHVYTVELQRQGYWRRAQDVRICLKDGKRISRAAYDAAVHGKVDATERGTCQICLRRIGITTGLVAHHGYQRPGHGWQTASCYGAKHRPLEVACDAIEGAVFSLGNYIRTCDNAIATHLTAPPDELHHRDAYGRIVRTYQRPEGFDSSVKPVCYGPGYEAEYWPVITNLQRQIRLSQEDIVTLRKRLADWHPAVREVA